MFGLALAARLASPALLGGGGALAAMVAGANNRINTVSNAASTNNTRFKGIKRDFINFAGVDTLCFAWHPWRFILNDAAPIVDMPNSVTMGKVYVNLVGLDLSTVLGAAPVKAAGNRSFTISSGVDEFISDELRPADFGLSGWPATAYIELREMYDLTVGQSFPAAVGSGRPVAAQARSGTATTLPDDVDGSGTMSGSSTTFVGMFFPTVMARFKAPVRSWGLVGDSHTERTWDIVPNFPASSGNPLGGGGFLGRAVRLNGDHCFIAGIAGATALQWSNATRALNVIKMRANRATYLLGTNDIYGTMPGGSAGQPITTSYMLTKAQAICATLRGGRVQRVVGITLPPRIVDTNFKCTDLSQMTAVPTGATVAGGATRDGYGFASGETRDLWSAVVVGQNGYLFNDVYDLGTAVADTNETWKWKVDSWAATLAAAVSIGATTLSVSAVPPDFATLVLNPGVAGVEGNAGGPGGLVNLGVTGPGPYTIALTANDTLVGGPLTAAWAATTKTQASGAAVRRTISIDGIHLAPSEHIAQAALIAPKMAV